MAKKTTDEKDLQQMMQRAVNEYFNTHNAIPYNYRQVSAEIGAESPHDRAMVVEILEEMALAGVLNEVTPGKFKIKHQQRQCSVSQGRFIRRSNGKNSVLLDSGGDPIFIAERNSMHALNGDIVKVHLSARRKDHEPEAEVIEILEKKDQVFVGTLKVDKYSGLLETDSKFLATDIFIPKNKLKGGKTGDKAIVKIVDWADDSNTPTGNVVDILGETGDNNAEIHAILAEFGLPYHYPEDVDKAAQKIEAGITPEEVAARRDMRKITTFTIDPKDAKDFDDALSIRWLDNGNVEVGVHIADVTHYVTPDSIIEKEAESRATSVYLVDRVVPMLPEHLCNGICSLRPDEDKLTFSCVFEMDANANVVKSEICRTVIRSNRRYAYEEAQEIIETGKGEYSREILELDRLAKIMRKRRYDEGSIEFGRVEVRFNIDETGRPVSVFFKESKDANKLIEEWMLLANRTVAKFVGCPPRGKKPKAFVYRVHDMPDAEKLENFAAIARQFGYRVKTNGKPNEVNQSINKLLVEIKGRGEENLLSTLAIRSMAKAIYTTENIGHYGLAFDYYTHFTSPIRRYPDMMVHRLLAKYLSGGRSANLEHLESECKHSSEMETLAANAERASIKYKQVEYLGERLGEVYDGVISGVTEWGLYVELDENKCEGLVPVRDLEDDYYDFDEKNYCLIGENKHRRYQLGDHVKIQVARADLLKKQLDFAIVDELHPANPELKNGVMITHKNRNSRRLEKERDRYESRSMSPNIKGKKDKKGGKGSRKGSRRGGRKRR